MSTRSSDFYVWRTGPARRTTTPRTRELREVLGRVGAQPARRRPSSRSARPASGSVWRARSTSPSPGPDGRLAGGRDATGLPPQHRRAPRAVAAAQLQGEARPVGQDVYLFHGVARENAKDERLFALAEVRDLTPVRDATAGVVGGCPELEHTLLEAFHAIRAAAGPPPPRAAAALEPRQCSTCGPPLAGAPRGDRGHRPASAPARPRPRPREDRPAPARAGTPGRPAGHGALRLSNPPGSREMTLCEPRRPAAAARSTTTRSIDRARRAHRLPLRDGQDARARGEQRGDFPRGEFEEYDLDDGRRPRVRSSAARENRANIVVGLVRNFTPNAPRGHDPRGPARRPHARAGLARRAGVPADHRRPRPGRGARRAAWSGSPSPPAPRSPWTAAPRTWTGSPRCCAGSSSSRSRAATSQRRRRRASTSAPSPTGTPRRRC